MSKVQSNKQKKNDSLLNTAFDLFTEKGLNKTTISDIVEKAGVAKGTFYLYFKDKYDIRNKLISSKSSQLFIDAYNSLLEQKPNCSFEDGLWYIVEHILDSLTENKALLSFLHKDLSWGVFKKAFEDTPVVEDENFATFYLKMLNQSDVKYRDPEIMLFLIVELVGSAGYSSIMFSDPCNISDLKPYLKDVIHGILQTHSV
ncbi:MAG: TetR/AcrR family transcriptional regulator [Lachnospiraceae bacterium]|nr:TetR/AcrR family transcriptional regulator [Lachnospiraceae bacterium]